MQSSPRNRAVILLALVALISACADSFDHRDSIKLGVGNAPAANTAIQTLNTWPLNVENTDIVRKP